MLHRAATRFNTLQHAATRCSSLQHTLANTYPISFLLFDALAVVSATEGTMQV